MTNNTGEHLTTSRISRLLRPLRAKCHKLASYPSEELSQPSKGIVVVTYGSSSRQSSADPSLKQGSPPLSVIPPPEKLSALSKLDRSSRENLDLSRRIYDIRDAFRNILQIALQAASTSRKSSASPTHRYPGDRMRSLAAMCAARVGTHVEDQVMLAAEEEDDGLDDDEELKVIDSLYEAVYPQYRKYTIISHAISIILSTCPSNHSLLAILLDVTVSYNLISESRILLRHMFAYVLQPFVPNGFRPTAILIAHSAHSRYLIQLLDTCRQLQGETLSERAYIALLSETISEAPSAPTTQFWTSRATVHLARTLRSRDYAAFLSLCFSVGVFLSSHSELSSRRQEKDPEAEDGLDEVAGRLGKWLSHACQHLYDLCSSTIDATALEEIEIISDILVCANASGLHRLHWLVDAEVLTDAIVCLSTMSVASPTSSYLSPAALASCHSILHGIQPKPGLFDILVAVTNPQMPGAEEHHLQTPTNIISSTVPALQRWAHILRDRSYHLLESSLWSSALNYIESLTPETGSHYDPASHRTAFISELERLRYEIVRRVEDAERRCFNNDEKLQVSSAQTPRKGNLSNDGWRWEDMVGCWVQKTPICTAHAIGTKRRRSVVEDAMVAEKHPRIGTLSAPPVSRSAKPKKRKSSIRAGSVSSSATTGSSEPPCSSMSHRRLTRTSFAALPSPQTSTPSMDQENAFSRLPRTKYAPSRRMSNFTSILRDAQVNRVVLHAGTLGDENVWRGDSNGAMKRSTSAGRSSLSDDEDEDDPKTAAGVFSTDHPSSDDALDLFAYRSSDW